MLPTWAVRPWPAMLAALFALLAVSAPPARAVESLPLPFVAGEAVRVIQGYNGGTHQGRSLYALDLVLASGQTSGAPVLSPVDGRVAWTTEGGCIGITFKNGDYTLTLCHVILDATLGRRDPIVRGQVLGTVGPPWTVGNNGTPHVHIDLQKRDVGPVPFSLPEGVLLEGLDLAASGAYNEHGFIPPIVSSNSRAISQTERDSGLVAAEAQEGSGDHCGPGQRPDYVFGFAVLKGQLEESMGEPLTCEFPDPNGTGDVHQITTTGLAFWRKSSNTPTFTNGWDHWALVGEGLRHWLGASIDPPD